MNGYITNLKQRCDVKTLSYIETVERQLQAEREAHTALRKNLKSIEYLQDGMCKLCPACGIVEGLGHTDGCWIGNALKEGE